MSKHESYCLSVFSVMYEKGGESMNIIEYDARLAFRRSKGYCECNDCNHGHHERCQNPVLWRNRGIKSYYGALIGVWEARYIIHPKAGGKRYFTNVQIICCECDKKLRRFIIRTKN